jgi:ABC-type spermidine/putrescine transport system permease subunit I
MRKKISNFFHVGRRFKREFRKQLRSFIIIALAFTVAFSWRQTTFDLSQTFVRFITNIQDSTASTILTSTFITLISIILIYTSSYLLKDSSENY